MSSYPDALNGDIIPDHQFTRGERGHKRKNFTRRIAKRFQYIINDFVLMFKNKILFRGIFNSTVYDGLFKTIKDYLQPILKTYVLSIPLLLALGDKRSAVVISCIYFFLYIFTSYTSRRSYKFSQSFSSLHSALNYSFLLGVGLTVFAGLFAAINLKIISIIIFISLYAFQNLRRPMNVGYISDNIKLKIMASGLSVESLLKTILIAIFSPFLGYLVDSFGVGNGLLILSGVVLLSYPLVRVYPVK